MKKLFVDNGSFDFISLKRLAQSYLENGSERIELAGFQRGATWKAANVEALWDSLLRWFPIGSILLARTKEFSDVKYREPQLSLSADYTEISKEKIDDDIYIMIDGQQRSNAIALGFLRWSHPKSSESGARLWIDLGDPVDRKNKLYDFYLCTSDEPFGDGLSVKQKQQALELIGKSGKDDSEINLNEAFPAKAKLPVPFAEFVELIKNGKDWENIQEHLLQKNYLNLSQATLSYVKDRFSKFLPRTDFEDLLKAVRDVVLDERYEIPAILFHNRENQVSSMQLYKLFERINVNGVTPPQAEMFFSVLKLKWPEIGDYVAIINNDSDLGGLFRPTEIILAALRLIKPEIIELTLANFDRITEDHQQALIDLLEHKAGDESVFLRCMRLTYQALHYRGDGDFGLPRQLIYRLRKRVWHTILNWIYLHRDEIGEDVSDSDRFNMVRFALLDSVDYFIFVGWRRGYSQYVNHSMFYRLLNDAVSNSTDFSAKNIFMSVKARSANDGWFNDSPLKIFTPQEYAAWISYDNKTEQLNWTTHSTGDVLLLYAQRDYLEKWKDLNDLDKDHIIPYYWMDFTATARNVKYWQVDSVGLNGRSPVINSPGNFRFWPASLNRQYQADKPTDKHIQSGVKAALDESHRERFLYEVSDVLAASFIDDDTLELIRGLEELKQGKDCHVWTPDQYKMFKRMVDTRCNKMYKNFFETMRLEEIDG